MAREPTPPVGPGRRSAVTHVVSQLSPLIAALDDLAEESTPEERQVISRYLRRAVTVLRQYEEAET